MKRIFLLLFISINIIGFSQDYGVSFKYVTKDNKNVNTAIFSIYGIKSDDAALLLKRKMLENPNIIDFKIFYNRRCKIKYNNSIDANDIRKILKEYNADYDIDYVNVLDKYTEEELYIMIKNNYSDYTDRHTNYRGDWIIPDDYPKANTIEEKETLGLRIEEWIEKNPEKYKKMTGKEYLDIATNKYIVK